MSAVVVFTSGNLVCPAAKLSPRVPAGFRGHSSQPAAALPLTLYISYACLACAFSAVSAPLGSSCCQAAPLPASSVWFPPIWRPHWVPQATQPLGNSNRWGGTASLTDGPTEAGLLLHSSLGNRRQELSHHGCLLNRKGVGGAELPASHKLGCLKERGLEGQGGCVSYPHLFLGPTILFGSNSIGFAWHWAG